MNTPNFGFDVAMNKLRPFAKYDYSGGVFNRWEDPTGSIPPTIDEINEQINKDKEQWHISQK